MKKNREKLQCLQATKMIPSFIVGELSYRELEQFMEHMEECESCKEELSIQFLVEVGLNSLEAGNTFGRGGRKGPAVSFFPARSSGAGMHWDSRRFALGASFAFESDGIGR